MRFAAILLLFFAEVANAAPVTYTVTNATDAALANMDCTTEPDCTGGACTLRQVAMHAGCDGVDTIVNLSVASISINAAAGPIIFGADGSTDFTNATENGQSVTVQATAAQPATLNGGAGQLEFAPDIGAVTLNYLNFKGSDASAGTQFGGAITRVFVSSSSNTLAIKSCTFTSNKAQIGGAIAGSGTLTLDGCTFTNNSAVTAGEGGALYLNTYSALTVTNTTFSNNSSTYGGAVFLDSDYDDGAISFTDTLFADNAAQTSGGGIYARAGFDLHNVTFFQNTATAATSQGGAMDLSSTDGASFTFNNVTVNQNAANDGSAVYLDAYNSTAFLVSNSILSGNRLTGASGGQECVFTDGVVPTSANYNLFGTTCFLTPAANDLITNAPGLANALTAAPVAGDPLPATKILALTPGSPAIDAGNPAAVGNAPACESQDQRHEPRPQLVACDIGAFEYTPSADVGIVKQSSADPVQGQTIVYTLVVSNSGPNAASNVKVSDPLPASLSACTVSPTTSCTITSGTLSCAFPQLLAGSSVPILLSCTATAAGALTNTATVTHDDPDPNSGNDQSTDNTTVTAASAPVCGPATPEICGSVLPANVDCAAVESCLSDIQNGSFSGTAFAQKGCEQIGAPSFFLAALFILWRAKKRRRR